MSLVSSLELLLYAQKNKIAIPAFNVDNLESCMAVTEVIKELRTPVIIQTIPRTLKYGGVATYPAIINELMQDSDVDYCLHLDHGGDLEIAKECQKAGYSSVMIDASHLPFTDNVKLTREVVDFMRDKNVSVEGELGAIGGKEERDEVLKSSYTDLDEAALFVEKTDVDALAIGVGTAHGLYQGTPKINIDRIKEIKNVIDTPLVLHGATGLSDEVIIKCIESGITKINYATEIRIAFTDSIRHFLASDADVFDPKIYLRKAVDAMKYAMTNKIKLLYRFS